jgi:hypothetical protein
VVDVRWWLSMVADVAVTVAVSRTTEAQAVDVRGLVHWSGCRTVQHWKTRRTSSVWMRRCVG